VRFYSAEWVAAFNEAVTGVQASPVTSLRMVQQVHGAPDGPFSVALEISDGRIVLERDPDPDLPVQVTISVSYDDAAALSRGELDPAQLLATGRVKVRGDLSVLVRGQELLAEAAARAAALSAATTF
jgi:putative sterol carrier protein